MTETSQLIAEAKARGYREGRRDALKLVLAFFSECRTENSFRVRFTIFRVLSGQILGDAKSLAKKLNISKVMVYREMKRIREFTKSF